MKDFNNIKAAYFIGIKGVGMTALAIALQQRGIYVLGSDVDEEFVTDRQLKRNKIAILHGFNKSNISSNLSKYEPGEVLVVVTGAHNGMKNTEALESKKRRFAVYMHGEALGLAMRGKKGISVAGTHGKTTTSAIIAHILSKAKLHPSFAIGAGSVMSLSSSGAWDAGDYFVAEADEYVTDPQTNKKPRFLYQKPHISIITSIDYDHPDVFESLSDVKNAFYQFIVQTEKNGLAIINADDKACLEIAKNLPSMITTYGISEDADVQIGSISIVNQKSYFEVIINNKTMFRSYLKIPGFHNIQNAVAASIAAHKAGVSWKNIGKHLKTFTGTKRRFEYIGTTKKGIIVYDDYAHHPSEIQKTIEAACIWFPKARIAVLFQPHTYSRTKALFNEFITSFSKACLIGILPIFASAREKNDESVSSLRLVQEIKKQNPKVEHIKSIQEFKDKMAKQLQANDILITMGAGDINTWHEQIIKSI